MSDQIAVQPSQPRKFASTLALLAGFVTVLVLSLATDQLFHILGVYPPWGEPMRGTGQNLLALSYRVVYAVLGSYIAARLAPRNPMRHAMILGAIGFVLSTLGADRAPSPPILARSGFRSGWCSPRCPAPGSAASSTRQ